MRTTIDLEDQILAVVRDLAHVENRSMGNVLSDLAREALLKRIPTAGFSKRNGVPLLPRRPGAAPVTMELIDRIREEEGV